MDFKEAPQEFFEDVAEKLEGIKAIVKRYGLEDQWVSVFVGGIYTEGEEGEAKLKTVLDYVVVDEDELDEIASLALSYYEQMENPDGLPQNLEDTKGWTAEDWISYINKNTDGTAN